MEIKNPMYFEIPHYVKALTFSITKDAALYQMINIIIIAIHNDNSDCPVTSFDMVADPVPCGPIVYQLPFTPEHKLFKLYLTGLYSKDGKWHMHPRAHMVGGAIAEYVMFGYDDDWDHVDYNDIVLTIKYTK